MLQEGVQISHYRLLHKIGEGGMGDVYLAEHMHLKTQVAIKVIKPTTISNPDAMRLFLREATAIARLDHPRILPLFDYGEATIKGSVYPYIVMPMRPEGSLKTWLQQGGKRSLRTIVEMVAQAAEALQHAHDRQIIHLDIKPSNFLLRYTTGDTERPDLLLTDFGLAKVMNADISMSNTSRGTPPYMAPEQWEGHPVTASDQYALAVMTYELLTGRTPFVGNMQEVMYQHLTGTPKPPSTFNSRISSEIDEVLLRALAKQPEDRFVNVSEFADAFRQAALPTRSEGTTPSNVLRTTLVISQDEAMVGTNRTLSLPGMQKVDIHIPAGVHDGQILRLPVQEKTTNTSSSSGINTLIVTVAITSGIEIERIPSPPPLKTWLTVGLALLLVLASLGLFAIVRNHQQTIDQANATAAAHINLTSTTHNRLLATNATASAIVNATAAAQANIATAAARTDAVATADTQNVVATATAEQNIYIQATKGTPILNDPLVNNQLGYEWNEIPTVSQGGTCSFIASAYHATQSISNQFYRCAAAQTDYSNFVYQVEATVQIGDEAGIIFRFDRALATFYTFHISTDGAYSLDIDNHNGFVSGLSEGHSLAIKIGHNQTNLIAVVAKGSSLYLFVNQQYVTSAKDSTYSRGSIGVFAQDDATATNVAFTNAKVWQL